MSACPTAPTLQPFHAELPNADESPWAGPIGSDARSGNDSPAAESPHNAGAATSGNLREFVGILLDQVDVPDDGPEVEQALHDLGRATQARSIRLARQLKDVKNEVAGLLVERCSAKLKVTNGDIQYAELSARNVKLQDDYDELQQRMGDQVTELRAKLQAAEDTVARSDKAQAALLRDIQRACEKHVDNTQDLVQIFHEVLKNVTGADPEQQRNASAALQAELAKMRQDAVAPPVSDQPAESETEGTPGGADKPDATKASRRSAVVVCLVLVLIAAGAFCAIAPALRPKDPEPTRCVVERLGRSGLVRTM